MKDLNLIEPDELMKKLVARFCREIRVGSIYFLMARYSKKTCDKAWMKNSNYICMNIRCGKCIYAVDLFPYDDRVIFSLFVRSKESLYLMSNGKNDKNGTDKESVKEIVDCLKYKFKESNDALKRYEYSQMFIDTNISDVSEKISDILSNIMNCINTSKNREEEGAYE